MLILPVKDNILASDGASRLLEVSAQTNDVQWVICLRPQVSTRRSKRYFLGDLLDVEREAGDQFKVLVQSLWLHQNVSSKTFTSSVA